MKSGVRYSPNGANGNSKLTLHLRPEKVEQTRKIVDLLAEYVSIQTGARQEVVPMGDGFYYVGNAGAALTNVNYRIFYDGSFKSELVGARITIFTDADCSAELKTLETFVRDVILQ